MRGSPSHAQLEITKWRCENSHLRTQVSTLQARVEAGDRLREVAGEYWFNSRIADAIAAYDALKTEDAQIEKGK
jgi:hypothetical protein